jgi:aminoglycoside 6-adenylyltransferase
MGKYFERLLPPAIWQAYLKTYSDAEYDHVWDAMFTMTDLFREVAQPVADHFGFSYPSGDDARVTAFLRHVRTLPPDAARIYEEV